jgi:sugar lactone lactonase YvrE
MTSTTVTGLNSGTYYFKVYVCDAVSQCIGSNEVSGARAVTVTTLAGSGVAGYADGTGAAAQFAGLLSIAVDSSGNIYVADNNNNRIRKIDPSGVVTTVAGSGVAGYADGTGAAAEFNSPQGIVVDSTGNNRIRKINTSGVVTTVAGSGVAGYADGTGTAAQFYYPEGVAVDSSGNIYVVDDNNNRIRKIDTSGVVTTVAGSSQGYADGTGAAAQFYHPCFIAVDSSGNIYVTDQFNHRIRKITPDGVVTTVAGSGVAGFADGTGTDAQFAYPDGVAVDSSGNIYVGDVNNQRVRKIDTSGVVTTVAGSTEGYADGTGAAAQFNYPRGVAVDSSGNIYVGDTGNPRIRKITP